MGLNSGTSADGVDAVACEITGRGLRMRVRVIGHFARRYPNDLRRRILSAMAPAETRTEEICRLHGEIGRFFAGTSAALAKRLALKRIDLVGSHGQTVCHLPPSVSRRVSGTLQIGEAAFISIGLGVPVVSQFRQADMVAGGQGAPLVPWTDYVLFRHSKRSRVVQNIGGIANLTWLPAGGRVDDVTAFDTGPGNMLIDALVSHFTKGKVTYDKNGSLGRRGRVRHEVLTHMLEHPYLTKRPPKSCGREEFGVVWMEDLLKRFRGRRIPSSDWIATATHFTAVTIASGYRSFSDSRRRRSPPLDEVILCGGGAKNKALVRSLTTAVAENMNGRRIEFKTTADYGIPFQAKEGASFAMLAAACVDRVAANLPGVTGARDRVILGQLCHGVSESSIYGSESR
ncbi:MAG: anhydro-N-acetylmuramic acid kinase [Phycisphaerales bacterium]|nr:anhydro-N-acetylmuramic acid kinase [Phycisphaerales bacterium]